LEFSNRINIDKFKNTGGTNVRSYKDEELLDRVKSLDTFTHIPKGNWLIGVQSNEDEANVFDDKFYLFNGETFIKNFAGTTNAGIKGLKHFDDYNDLGVAVLKTDTIVYDFWKRGLHKGRVKAGRQNKPFPYHRDNNKNDNIDEIGKVYSDIIWCNFHPATYEEGSGVPKEFINGWSLVCQVPQKRIDFEFVMERDWEFLTYCLLKEF
jgi:hypothetical protein